MISFADIPFSECARHCDRYSHFGLSFDKGYLANCYASPVGYVQHPFIDNNYSYIWHVLQGMKSVLNGTGVPEGLRKGEKFDALHLLSRFQYMMAFLEGYSKAKYEYNEGAVEPLPDQEHFFEDSSALYYEREWRMVLSSTGRDLAWHVTRDGKTYFKFNERFLRWVIVPRTHLAKLKAERANIFSDYPPDQVSPIIAYEDMEYF
jgi:hypothetical protein